MEPHKQHPHLPRVLIIKPPPPPLTLFPHKFLSTKFNLLKAYESPLPLTDFLTINSNSIQAILCSGASPVTVEILNQLPCLQLVVTASAGVNHINGNECRRRGIAVANSGNVFSDECADAAVGLLISLWRKIVSGDTFVRGLWSMQGEFALGTKVRLLLTTVSLLSLLFLSLCMLWFIIFSYIKSAL